MPSFKLGYTGVLYYATTNIDREIGGTGTVDAANAVWNEIDNVTDVDDAFSSEKVDTTTRSEAKKGWASKINTTKNGTIKFQMRWKPSDAAFIKMRKAWITGGEISLLDMDGPIGNAIHAGNQGFVGNFTLEFTRKMPVKGIMMVDVTAELSSFPEWVEVNGSGVLIKAPTT